MDKKNFIRDTAARKFINDNPDARAIIGKDYTFVVPIENENGEVEGWARLGITSCQMNDTKTRAGFNPDTDSLPALEAFENMLEERAANEAAREAERAAKKNKKKNKEEEEE